MHTKTVNYAKCSCGEYLGTFHIDITKEPIEVSSSFKFDEVVQKHLNLGHSIHKTINMPTHLH